MRWAWGPRTPKAFGSKACHILASYFNGLSARTSIVPGTHFPDEPVVTAFVTTAAALGAANLLRWRQHQGRALRAVGSSATRRGVDLVMVGAGFVVLALTVY